MGYRGAEQNKKHLSFHKLPLVKGKKMRKYRVVNDTFNEEIGIMHFRGGWRQYVFRAHTGVDMTKGCHKEVDDFRDKLMDEWKASLKNRKKK